MAEIIYFNNSSLTESTATLICHQVNCLGKMGSGVAKSIKDKWPIVYDKYIEYYNESQRAPGPPLGCCQLVSLMDYYHNSNQYVVNMFAQFKYGYDGERYTNYEAFYKCLERIKEIIIKSPDVKSIAFPYKIGCDRGGGNWNIIRTMIEEVFKDVNIKIEIHSLN